MDRIFENKVAIVTGGARGIGKCICEEFEKQGAKVCVIDLLDTAENVDDFVHNKKLLPFLACKKTRFPFR